MTVYVDPGARFYVRYVSDGSQLEFPVPDVSAQSEDVLVFINGLFQPPVLNYTVHAGLLSLTQGPVPEGFVLEIRS